MNGWHYLLLVNFYLVLFFGFYTLLLRKETFFQLNRIYLVAAALLSFIIPIIQADWVKNLFITQEVQQTIYSGPIAMVYYFTPAAQSALTLGQILNAAYITVTLFLMLRLVWQLVILKKAIDRPSPSAAYAFFKKISLGENTSQSKIIAAHEQVHASQWHSVDVMIIETVMIINWFNPVVYLYRFAIKYIHEFIADRQVIQAGTDKVDYALLLLSQTFEVDNHNLVTPFYNHSLLKQRITMLQKNKSQRIALAKYGLSAPLFILMMIFSSATVNNSSAITAINKKAEKVLQTPAADIAGTIADHAEIPYDNEIKAAVDTVPGSSKVFSMVEVMPEFPGGLKAFSLFLAQNIHYPAADRKSQIQGKVIVSFVVEQNGTLSDIKAIRGPSETLIDEAIRVMKTSPKWKPGFQNGHKVRVSYTIPISFVLNPTAAPTAISGNNKASLPADKNQPRFPGGLESFGHFLGSNIRYPAADREKGITGKVICTFIVEADGTLSDIKAVRGPSETLNAEAVRVMKRSPRWVPGIKDGHAVRTSYTVPINFVLGDEPVHKSKTNSSTMKIGESGPPPLYILDGVEMEPTPGKSPLSAIPQEDIASMEVLKDAATTALYGEKGKNGVILITTKKNKKPADAAITPVSKIEGNALYIIDGKEIKSKDGTSVLSTIPQETIAGMEVLTGTNATSIYGEKGKNGVIIITIKKPAAKP